MFQVSAMYSPCSPAGFYQDGSPSVFLTVHQAKNSTESSEYLENIRSKYVEGKWPPSSIVYKKKPASICTSFVVFEHKNYFGFSSSIRKPRRIIVRVLLLEFDFFLRGIF